MWLHMAVQHTCFSGALGHSVAKYDREHAYLHELGTVLSKGNAKVVAFRCSSAGHWWMWFVETTYGFQFSAAFQCDPSVGTRKDLVMGGIS